MPRLAANLSTLFQHAPLIERFELAARCGFKAVELQFPYEIKAEALACALRSARLELVLINAPAGDLAAGELGLAAEGGARFEQSIHTAIDYARVAACPRLHVLIGPERDISAPDTRRRLVENLRWAADQCAAAGIDMMLEALKSIDRPGYGLPSLAHADRLRREIGRANVALQFDAYHAWRTGLDPLSLLSDYLPVTGHVQIADGTDRCEPDRDEAGAFLLALDQQGYGGWVGCEYVPRADTQGGLGWALRYGIHAPR